MFKNDKVKAQYERIMDLCTVRGISKYELAKGIGKTTSLFSDVVAGRVGLSGDVLQRCADYFDVSIDYLMTGEEPETKASVTTEDLKVALFHGDKEVTDEMWEEVKNFAEMVALKYRYKKKGNDDQS